MVMAAALSFGKSRVKSPPAASLTQASIHLGSVKWVAVVRQRVTNVEDRQRIHRRMHDTPAMHLRESKSNPPAGSMSIRPSGKHSDLITLHLSFTFYNVTPSILATTLDLFSSKYLFLSVISPLSVISGSMLNNKTCAKLLSDLAEESCA